MFDLEETVMGLIINAGMSRSLCFEALRQADELFRQAQAQHEESTAQKVIDFILSDPEDEDPDDDGQG